MVIFLSNYILNPHLKRQLNKNNKSEILHLIPIKVIIIMKKKLIYSLVLILSIIIFYPIGYFVSHETKSSRIEQKEEGPLQKEPHVFLINLDRSKERLHKIKPLVEQLGFNVERIAAVDGSLLPDNIIKEKVNEKKYLKQMGEFPKRGTVGCSLSHIKAWEKFLQSNSEFAIIFEDDISFDPQKMKKIIEELIQNQHLWDVVTFEIHRKGNPLTLKKLKNQQELVVYLTEVTDAGAYILNRQAAKKLLAKTLPINMPIDLYYGRGWEFDLKFTGIENPRLIQQTFGDSEIRKTHNIDYDSKSFFSRLPIKIHKAIFRIQTMIIRFVYNLKLYAQLKSKA